MRKTIQLATGFDSGTAPDITSSETRKFISYADSTAYETAHGAPSGGEVFYNTTSGKVQVYDAIESEWVNVGSLDDLTWQQEALGIGNGINTVFTLSNLPFTPSGILVFINGAAVPPSEYSFLNPDITFNTAPSAGQYVDVYYPSTGAPSTPVIPSAGTEVVTYPTMTATDISNGFITLPSAPSTASNTQLDLIGGSSQEYGSDFTVSGSVLTFTGNLATILQENDTLRVFYFN